MKATREYLKQLIKEQIREQEKDDAAAAAEKAFDQAVDQTGAGDIDKNTPSQKNVPSNELRKDIIDVSKKLAGIMQNEMDIVQFALSLIQAAKESNLNVEILRKRLGLVQDELQKIQKVES